MIKTVRENPTVVKIVEDPIVDTTVKTIAVTGVGVAIGSGLQGLMPLATKVPDLIFIPYRLFLLFISIVFGKRKPKPWGVVYDSVTKQPLDPVYITLKNRKGEIIKTKISDMNGRFGFLVKPGEYYIKAEKTHYKFPSSFTPSEKDELYENLYHGEYLKITDSHLINVNIPMDPLAFDWNEFAKRKVIKFNYHRELFKRWFPNVIFTIGLILMIVFYILNPITFNLAMVGSYLILAILRKIGFKQKQWGMILDKKTKKPLPFAVLKIFYEKLAHQIHFVTADVMGRYYALVEPGKYDLTIEKKTKQGYEFAAKVSGFEAPKGVLNKDLFIEVK